MMRQYLFQ